jgi:hypothetical protein
LYLGQHLYGSRFLPNPIEPLQRGAKSVLDQYQDEWGSPAGPTGDHSW